MERSLGMIKELNIISAPLKKKKCPKPKPYGRYEETKQMAQLYL
jgi:hypothetical protein